jgi:predicted CopG family antitoxin
MLLKTIVVQRLSFSDLFYSISEKKRNSLDYHLPFNNTSEISKTIKDYLYTFNMWSILRT